MIKKNQKSKRSTVLSSGIAKYAIGIILGVICLYLAFRNVDLDEMIGSIARANFWYIMLSVASLMFSHYLRALRWRLLLAPMKKINSWGLFSALMIGYTANTFLPAHLGEFLRAFVIGKKHNIVTSSVFASIVLERIIDVLSLLVLMAVLMYIHPLPDWLFNSGLIMLAGSSLLFITLLALKLSETHASKVLLLLMSPLPGKIDQKLNLMFSNFLSGLMPLKAFIHYFYAALLSISIWFCYALIYYFCIQAFDLHNIYDLSWRVALVVLVFTTISIVIPSSPGYVGTYHYLCQLALMLFGVSSTEALSYATVAHAITIIPVTLLGLLLANYEGIAIYRATSTKHHVPSMR